MRASFILCASFLAALAMTADGAFAATTITGSKSNGSEMTVVDPGKCTVPGTTEADCTDPTTAKQVPTKLPNAKGGCPPGTTPYDLDYRGPGTMRCRVNNN